jgi:hypothetical protein
MFTHLTNLLLAQSTGDRLQALLQIDPDERFPLLVVCVVFAVGLMVATVAIVGGLIHSYQRRRLEVDFKRELLDRGLSPEEVARIVEASSGKSDHGGPVT